MREWKKNYMLEWYASRERVQEKLLWRNKNELMKESGLTDDKKGKRGEGGDLNMKVYQLKLCMRVYMGS